MQNLLDMYFIILLEFNPNILMQLRRHLEISFAEFSNFLWVLAHQLGSYSFNTIFKAIGFPKVSNPDLSTGSLSSDDKKILMQVAIYLGDLGISFKIYSFSSIFLARYRERIVDIRNQPNRDNLCELIYSEASSCFPNSGHPYNMIAVCKCLYDDPIIVTFYYVKRYNSKVYLDVY